MILVSSAVQRAILVMAVMAASTAGAGPPGDRLHPSLTVETSRPRPGQVVTIAIQMRPDQGWHGYWLNPGDSGFPLQTEWSLPPGFRVGPLRYPTPSRQSFGGLVAHIFPGAYAVLADVVVPADARAGEPFAIAVDLKWLACSTAMCAPARGRLTTAITIGSGDIAPVKRREFEAMRAALPRPRAEPATYSIAGSRLRLRIPVGRSEPVSNPLFFPEASGLIDLSARQKSYRDATSLIIDLKLKAAAPITPVKGVLVPSPNASFAIIARGDGTR